MGYFHIFKSPLILVSLTFWVPHIDSFNISKFVVLGIGVLTLSALALPNLRVKSQAKIGAYLLLFFVMMLMVNLLTSPNTYKSLIGALGRNNGVLTYFCLAVLAYLVSTHFKLTDLPKLLWSLVGLGVIQTIYNILQLAGENVKNCLYSIPYLFSFKLVIDAKTVLTTRINTSRRIGNE